MFFYVLMCFFFFFNSENFSLVFLSAFFPQCHTELLCGQWDFCLFCTWRYAVARNTACMKYLKAGSCFLPSPFRIIFLFFGRKKKTRTTKQTEHSNFEAKLFFFFFFSRTLWEKQQQQTADAGIWVGPECFSLGNQQHAVAVGHRGCILLSGLVCGAGDHLVEPQAFGVSFPNLIARGGMLVPLSFPPWV